MPKGLGSTILKLLIASLLVGLVMSWFDITPRSLIENFGDTVVRMFANLASFFGWAVDYILLGAVIVVPLWLIVFLIDRMKGRRSE
jgi:uncharacterized oligopeptide transporter (OPT) family protein